MYEDHTTVQAVVGDVVGHTRDSGIFKHSMVCSSCGKHVAGGDEAFAQTADFAMVFSTISTTQQYANSVGVVEYKAQVEQNLPPARIHDTEQEIVGSANQIDILHPEGIGGERGDTFASSKQ